METHLQAMHDLGVRLAREAGDYAVAQLDADNGIRDKGANGDVVTQVDHEVERRIIAAIRKAFPDHAVLGEESGLVGDAGAPVTWLVDPLDGTNNYVIGLPMFGVCITACAGDKAVVGVVHDSVRGTTTSAIHGRGAFRNGARLRMGEPVALERATVSWTQGYGVAHGDPFRARAVEAMESNTKRVLRTWAPSIDWGLIAAGHIGAFVAYRNERWDLAGGAMIVREAGGEVYAAPDPGLDCVIAGHPGTVAALRELLGI